jgi:hypothetical protein
MILGEAHIAGEDAETRTHGAVRRRQHPDVVTRPNTERRELMLVQMEPGDPEELLGLDQLAVGVTEGVGVVLGADAGMGAARPSQAELRR